MTRTGIAVVGSLNVDLVVPVPHHPVPGETVLGGDHLRTPGGKGGNQAVAAARLGQRVRMVSRVGGDDFGRLLVDALLADGVDTTRVLTSSDAPTGIALITVDEQGENAIAVSPGANARLSPGDVTAAAASLSSAAVTLLQLEVPLPAVEMASTLAGGIVVLNPAPAQFLPPALLGRADVLVPNRLELAILAGTDTPPQNLDEVAALALELPTEAAVVVTLGAQGALVCAADVVTHVPATPATVVDTTGAGDAFCGGLADALSRGLEIEAAAAWATKVAVIAVSRRGAQAAMPRQAELHRRRHLRDPGGPSGTGAEGVV